MSRPEALQIIPIGGLGEVGMNMTIFGFGDDWFVVDAGVQFCDPSVVGAEKVLPDLDCLLAYRGRIRAFVLTHAHEDHIGALEHVMEVCRAPVYGPSFAVELIREKAREFGEMGSLDLRVVGPGDHVDVGPVRIEFVRVTHSIPDSHALAMHTPVGTVVHTGDFKIDPDPVDGRAFDRERFGRLGDAGVRLLLSDSTNAEARGHTRGEREVAHSLAQMIAEARGRVIVSMFASNVHRMKGLVEAARQTGRRLALVGRSLSVYLAAALRSGQRIEMPDLVDQGSLDRVPENRLLVVCTGSQAEGRSALLRASNREHPDLSIRNGDRLIMSSRMIPGNERAILRMINRLSLLGAEVLHERNAPVHGSGHAQREELKEMLSLVRPHSFIPVHGEFVYLASHAGLAREAGVPDVKVVANGDVIEVTRETVTVVDQVQLNPYYVDGPTVGDADELKLAERRRLAWNGAVALKLAVRRGPRGLKATAELQAVGIPDMGGNLVEVARGHVVEALSGMSRDAGRKEIEDAAATALRALFRRRLEKRPAIMTFLDVAER